MIKRILFALIICLFARCYSEAQEGQLVPTDWIKISPTFGPGDNWQFGIDKSLTAGACAGYAIRSKLFMAGPCRDVLLLAKDKYRVFHLGFASLQNEGAHPALRGGVDVGRFVGLGVNWTVEHVPYLEFIRKLELPGWASYLTHISKVDYFATYDGKMIDHGPMLKVDIPLPDLLALLPTKGG